MISRRPAGTPGSDRYLAEPEGPPLVSEHRDRGARTHVEIHCDDGHEVGDFRPVRPKPGPGARRR